MIKGQAFRTGALGAIAASLLLWPGASGTGRAADDAGAHAFWTSQNGTPARSQPAAPAPVPAPSQSELAPRIMRAISAPKKDRVPTSYARLPSDERSSVPVQVAPAVARAPDPLSAILRDPTLRSGDIVMFVDGPRVYTGSGGERHRLRDFESASSSQALSAPARKQLVALTAKPRRPATEAYRYVPVTNGQVRGADVNQVVAGDAIRVVYPGLGTR